MPTTDNRHLNTRRLDERPFRIRFLDECGSTILQFRMHAPEAEAVGIATVLYQACCDVCAATEVWQGHSPVAYTRPFGGQPSREELSSAAQQIVLDREMLLRDSRTCIADSRRLLRELRFWAADMTPQT